MNDQTFTTDQNTSLDAEIKPAIYSRKVITVFSILFSTVFGGIMVMKNLKSIGEKKAANLALLCSLAYTVLAIIIINSFGLNKSSLGFVCYSIGAIIPEYFFKKYFPDADTYEKKPIWIPLIIGIVILAFFVLCIVYAGPDAQ